MTRSISSTDMANEFVEVRVQFRGTEYVLRELPMDAYDKTVEQATTKTADGEETFDGAAHTKILLAKSLDEPKMTIEQIYAKGTRLVRGLQEKLRELYWVAEPDELVAADKEADKEDDSEGEAPAAS